MTFGPFTSPRLTFRVECGLGSGDSGCGTRRDFTAQCGSLEITQPPTDGATCAWSVTSSPGHLINVTFDYFHIPEIGELSCTL